MDLNHRQTRRLYLAETTPFPLLFPSVGTISIEMGSLAHSPIGQSDAESQVIIREEPGPDDATTRIVLVEHVTAIFLSAAEGNQVENFEDGVWLLGPNVKHEKLAEQLEAERVRRGSDPRGIVFIPEYRPVLTIHESTQKAGAVCDSDKCSHFYCDPYN